MVMGVPMCFFGGGYLRLFPSFLVENMGLKVLREGRPVIFYVHPREIDPHHPRLPMSLRRKFKSYVNLKTTEAKIRRVLAEFEVTTFRAFIEEHIEQFMSVPDVPVAVPGPVAKPGAAKLGGQEA
jgi:hypothetical protein